MRRSPMRRTGFARNGFTGNKFGAFPRFELERAPIKASTLFRLATPASNEPTHQTPKLEPLRSEQYRRYVASFPCFRCGLVGSSQCAHANMGKGMGVKVCDRRTFPLCFPCHSDLDNSRGMTREQRRALEEQFVERMQAQARADRRPEFKEEIAS